MKKILSVFAMMAMLFAACTPEDQPGTNNGGNENEGGNNNGGENTEKPEAAPELKLTTAATLDFTAEGGDGSISYVISNPVEGATVSAACEADWVTGLKAGETRATFTVAPYESTEAPRSTKIVLTYDKAPAVEVNVTQQPAVPEINPDAPDVDFKASVMLCDYYGGDAMTGYNYWLILADVEPEVSLDGQIYPAEYSNIYFIDLYASVPVGDGEPVLPAGVYSSEDGSISLGDYTFYVHTESLDEDYPAVSFSKIDMTVEGNKIVVLAALANGEVHKVEYEGDLKLKMPEPRISTLAADYSVKSEMAAFLAINYGDYYEVGMDNYMIQVYSDMNALENGSCDAFNVEILTENDATFAGTYDCVNVYELESEDELTQCFLPGMFEITEDGYIQFYSTWYFTKTAAQIDGKAYAPLTDGTITFTEIEEGIFSCTFDTIDDRGNAISAELTGLAVIYDEDGQLLYPAMPDEPSAVKRMRSGFARNKYNILPVSPNKIEKIKFGR